ncbi:MAG: Asp-tRNA(Asn)/Glu-tRNA(Gln) amidotransferase subunit GatB [Clostridia bacterium]|nr:Asp-tRNA(Asn)/Glu-tRNA(Gln) amidotransferase subunit GatB [Clostridia bacterium]
MKFETVIGLEIHVELATRTKLFCDCENAFGGDQNTHCCPVCLGLPGSLPVINKHVVEFAVMTGLALDCTIDPESRMDRKNYHYPDMTKGFQTSQRYRPICTNGCLAFTSEDGTERRVGITEIHMEEDAGKLIHEGTRPVSSADYNRAAVPLIEIVTEPDLRSAEDARIFLAELRDILLELGVSDCRMEEGSMRCDVNVSVREVGGPLGTRTEIKNVNSFRSITRAIAYESRRQRELIERGGVVEQRTLRWDDAAGRTTTMRDKENSNDYRYFPEPDLPPIVLPDGMVEQLRAGLPKMPMARRAEYEAVGVPAADARLIAQTRWMRTLLDGALKLRADARTVSNTLIGPLSAFVNEGMEIPFTGAEMAEYAALVAQNKINSNGAKTLLEEMMKGGKQVDEIVREKSLLQVDDTEALKAVAVEVVSENPAAVESYLSGKEKAFTALMGAAMKKTRGKANPAVMRELILSLIVKE